MSLCSIAGPIELLKTTYTQAELLYRRFLNRTSLKAYVISPFKLRSLKQPVIQHEFQQTDGNWSDYRLDEHLPTVGRIAPLPIENGNAQ